MTERMRIIFDVPHEASVDEVVSAISDQIATGDESGAIDDGDAATLSWDMRPMGGGVEVDRRQRLAAAALLVGFNLPQEMMAASLSMLEAAETCPGLTTGELPDMGENGRRAALEYARKLIDEMLGECAA